MRLSLAAAIVLFAPPAFAERASLHATGGFALRVLESTLFGLYDPGTLFRISVAVDGARDYFGWSVGAGLFR